MRVTALRVRMGRPFTLAYGIESITYWKDPFANLNDQLYTTCKNLAFVMCAVRGWLRSQQGPTFYLASRGAEIGRNCVPCGACRADLSWDSCWITKQEYCTLSKACLNGHEVWHTKGLWTCVPNMAILNNIHMLA